MGNAGELARENEALRQRLSRLSEASLRTNDSDEPVRCAARRPRRRQRREPEPVRILCVDDDPETLRYVRDALTRAGYAPVVTEDVPRLMAEEPPRLVLLDLVLPGSGDGIELMGQVREIADVPVIFLSVYGQDEVIARAFDEGAADYVVKPFSPTELAARIRAALRQRAAPELAEPSRPYVRGELTVDYALRRVTLAGNPVALTAIEYRMLVELSANAGLPLTHQRPLQRVWGDGQGPGLRAGAEHRQEAAAQAGRRPGRSHLHLRLAHRRIPHGGGRDAGRGAIAA